MGPGHQSGIWPDRLLYVRRFATSLEGSDSAPPLANQIVPVIRDDSANKTELVIVNPGLASSSVTVTLFNARGDQVGAIPAQLLSGHAALRLASSSLSITGAGTLSARISASAPVSATAIIERGDALLFVAGQALDQPASVRIAPHFVTAGGFDPVLVLTNPAASAVTATVTIVTDAANPIFPAAASSRTFTIPANGSFPPISARLLASRSLQPSTDGCASILRISRWRER